MKVKDQQSLVTAEQLWEMPETPGVHFELVRGVLVEVPGTGALHSFISALVYRLLDAHVRPRKLGVVGTDGVSYALARDPDIVSVPDVSFVSRDRIPESGIPAGYWPFAPDLAVEIVSPNDRAADVQEKVREYLNGGSRMVWAVWSRSRMVSVHLPGGLVQELGPDEELDGGDVLPGFRVYVGDLFEVEY